MKSFKKIIALFCTAVMFTASIPVFAETDSDIPAEQIQSNISAEESSEQSPPPVVTDTPNTDIPEQTAEQIPTQSETAATPKSQQLSITVNIPQNELTLVSEAVFELYLPDNTLADTQKIAITKEYSSHTITFNVPEYELGTAFKLKLVSGIESIQYYDNFAYCGECTDLQTWFYRDEQGNDVIGNNFIVSAVTNKEKEIRIYKDSNPVVYSVRAKLIGNTAVVPLAETLQLFDINNITADNVYNSIGVRCNNKIVYFNIGYNYISIDNNIVYSSEPTQISDGTVYTPLRTIAEIFSAPIEVYDHGRYMDILIGNSYDALRDAAKQNFIANSNLTSSTNYLIWISKANYELNVFEKINGAWTLRETVTCAIGKPSTPTCVGTYRYYEKVNAWKYNSYYVGPIMRFNGGYAIHTTLIKYDGSDYDGRVGQMLSHGCVRVRPEDMNRLINYIPMYTTIHITNE